MLINVFFLPWTGAKEAFLNKTLLYRDEVVKKAIHQLAAPCYSVVLTSPQTALTVAHARKDMVKFTLTGEDKVITGLASVQLVSPFNNTRTLKFKTQLTIAFFTAANRWLSRQFSCYWRRSNFTPLCVIHVDISATCTLYHYFVRLLCSVSSTWLVQFFK